VQGDPGERISTAASAFATATISAVPTGVQARRLALIKKLSTFPPDGVKAAQVLAAAGFPAVPAAQATDALQDRIVAAQTDEAVKQLEDAFNTVK